MLLPSTGLYYSLYMGWGGEGGTGELNLAAENLDVIFSVIIYIKPAVVYFPARLPFSAHRERASLSQGRP